MSKGVSATFRYRLGATVSVELSPELVAKLKVDEEEFPKLLTEAVEALAAYMIRRGGRRRFGPGGVESSPGQCCYPWNQHHGSCRIVGRKKCCALTAFVLCLRTVVGI